MENIINCFLFQGIKCIDCTSGHHQCLRCPRVNVHDTWTDELHRMENNLSIIGLLEYEIEMISRTFDTLVGRTEWTMNRLDSKENRIRSGFHIYYLILKNYITFINTHMYIGLFEWIYLKRKYSFKLSVTDTEFKMKKGNIQNQNDFVYFYSNKQLIELKSKHFAFLKSISIQESCNDGAWRFQI